MGQRVYLPAYPEAELVAHNEEHLVIRTPRAGELQPGDALWAVPRHICPTSALHRWVYVAEAGKITGTWEVTARDRQLTL
jgi:D-serine deaminase-like pyridoxal phosphate-dependent protein